MDDFIIWTIPGSPFARAVMATLAEKGLSYRVRPLSPGGLKSEPHISRHPFGRMPAVEHGNFKLYETQAIIRYIDRLVPTPPLTPADPRAEARMNQLMGINDWYFFPDVGRTMVFPRSVAPRLGFPVDDSRIEGALPAAKACVAEIARLQGDLPFLAGDALSLADLLLAPQLAFLPEFAEGRALLSPHAKLSAWLARMEARPSMRATTWDEVTELARAA